MSIWGNPPRDWYARVNQNTGLVLCGYPRCDGELGYATVDESGAALGLVIPPGFEPFTRKGIWRLSNHARGRRPERGQTVRHRRYTAPIRPWARAGERTHRSRYCRWGWSAPNAAG